MSDEDDFSDETPQVDEVVDASDDTLAPAVGPGDVFPYPVAPTTDGKQINRIDIRFPVPIACWRLLHSFFAFGSSFILPPISHELRALAAVAGRDRLATIFGHADPVNSDDYNKRLSGRRARALYGLLTRNVDIWLDLYNPVDGDAWGLSSTQQMLAHLQRSDGSGAYYGASIDGLGGPATNAAVSAFQRDSGVVVDGDAGPVTRRALYAAYMDAVCISPSSPFSMAPDDFLGDPTRNATGDGKAAYQGCSEFNPVVIMSRQDQAAFTAEARNKRNDVNRRVMIFFFRRTDFGPVDGPTLARKWPCPAASEGAAGCRSQFWSNGEERRGATNQERTYAVDRQTMACAWYDRFARLSPCEGSEAGEVKIFLLDHFKQRMGTNPASSDPIEQTVGAPYRLLIGPGDARVGYADASGLLTEANVMATSACTLQWGRQEDAIAVEPPTDEESARDYYLYSRKIYLNTDGGADPQLRKLQNLGYLGTEDERRTDFAVDYGASSDDEIDDVHATGRPTALV